jgi:hypothetical protein
MKLHQFGDKWLHGLLLGYVQQQGGGFANKLVLVDWDDLNNAESVGGAMRQVKECHHKEVRPALYNDKIIFLLIGGDLEQPGVHAAVTRKITVRKRKIAEAVEAEETKQQEADAKRKKERNS